MSKCEYNNCGQPAIATENVTGTQMKLCKECFSALFSKLVKDAEIVDKT